MKLQLRKISTSVSVKGDKSFDMNIISQDKGGLVDGILPKILHPT